MDLIYTNANGIDQGVLAAYALDLSFGASENDFALTLGANEQLLEYGAFIYIEGTEYGGIVDGIKTSTNGDEIIYMGETWHGIMNGKVIQPDSGADYLIVSGEGNEVLSMMVARLGLAGLFVVSESLSGVSISNYQFERYCKGYDGIRAMLAANNAKLKFAWKDRAVHLFVEPVVDYTEAPVDGDIALLTVEQYQRKVNHLICLGKGDLAEREVIHLYVDQLGRILEGDADGYANGIKVQYYTGLNEIMDTYDSSSAESDELKKGGIERMTELRNNDKAEIALPETEGLFYDIGDIVGASEIKSGVTVAAFVSQKIVKINNGAISTEYKTGG